MALPDDFLQELRLRNDITGVVSNYVHLTRRGRNLVGLCPFHGEKTASFTVYPQTESFYCFGCGVGGDVIGFIKRAENLDYIDAVKFLAQKAGMQMPENSYDDSMQKLRVRIFEANREAARFFYSQLSVPAGKKGLEYLHSRRLADKTIKMFGLGFAPDSWSALTDHLLEKGFKQSELIQANLSSRNKNGGLIDRFRNRVMFPIIDVRGNVVAFGGRIMTDEKPKYLNTSDTPVFKKSGNLFALNRAKNSKSDKLILCEGYMDVIALHQAGFDFAVATLGTALTQEQAVILKRYTNTVVICYDADEAGQKATSRAIDILRKEGLDIRVLTVPDGKDPDEFIKHHGDNGYIKFKQLLEATGNDLEYRISKLRRSYNIQTPDGRVKFMTDAAKLLSGVDNAIERSVYIGALCMETGVDRKLFENEVSKNLRRRYKRQDEAEFKRIRQQLSGEDARLNFGEKKKVRAVRAEEALISYLILNPDMVRKVKEKLPPEKMVTEFNRQVYDILIQRIISGKSCTVTDLSSELGDDGDAKIAAMLANNISESNSLDACNDYVNIILDEGSKRSAEEIAMQSPEDIQAYMKELKEQKNKKR
ncbi:MAG: DNA primase [Clostridia bacterium]|nr:DNA primase [Clostridia bacterium]